MKHIRLIIISLFLLIAGFFTASVPLSPPLAAISSVSVLLLALPSFVGLYKSYHQRAVSALVLFSCFALAIESFAIITGFPYGRFIYSDLLGGKVGGIVPWTVPFAWTPLLLGSMALARQITHKKGKQILFSTLMLVLIDLLIDPGAVSLKFWLWQYPGIYYDVPFSNFAGWLFSGCLGSVLYTYFLPQEKHPQTIPLQISSLYFILLFWTTIALVKGLFGAVVFSMLLLGCMYWSKNNFYAQTTK